MLYLSFVTFFHHDLNVKVTVSLYEAQTCCKQCLYTAVQMFRDSVFSFFNKELIFLFKKNALYWLK